jgi:hypothetical protein
MTTEQLERDLESLAQPRKDDERLRLATRAHLGEQLLARPARPVGPARRFRWVAVAAALLVAAIVAISWPGGSAGPAAADAAIIRHALRAITSPANAIVHVKEVGVDGGTQVMAEWWQQTSPPHALRLIKGRGGMQGEGANDGTTSSVYDAKSNTIVETRASAPPTLVDPIESVHAQLARGGAHVAGTATIDGTIMYKIELPTGVIAYFDTTDYRPLYLDNPQGDDGRIVRTRVVTYEELPMTPDNAKLLNVTAQHPDARVRTRATPSK